MVRTNNMPIQKYYSVHSTCCVCRLSVVCTSDANLCAADAHKMVELLQIGERRGWRQLVRLPATHAAGMNRHD